SSLTDNTRIRLVQMDILTDGFPYILEYTCRSCKMYARKIGVLKDHLSRIRPGYIDQIDHTIRQSGFPKDLHQYIGRIDLCIRRFPHDNIAHHRHTRRQIARDSREIERGQSKHKPLQGALLYPIPYTLTICRRLLSIDFGHIFDVET